MADSQEKITTSCPDCGTVYRVRPEGVGRKAKCQCGTVFTVGAVPEPGAGYELATNEPGAPGASAYPADMGLPPIVHSSSLAPGFGVPGSAGGPGGPGGPRVIPGTMCINHATVPAVRRCKKCGVGVCATCGFSFPSGVLLCPTCATDTHVTLSTQRKTMTWFSIGLAIWATFVFLVAILGGLASLIRNKEDVAMVGCGIIALGWTPAVVGTGLGFGALDRRRGNTPLIWVGGIWNTAIIGLWLMRILIGHMGG